MSERLAAFGCQVADCLATPKKQMRRVVDGCALARRSPHFLVLDLKLICITLSQIDDSWPIELERSNLQFREHAETTNYKVGSTKRSFLVRSSKIEDQNFNMHHGK